MGINSNSCPDCFPPVLVGVFRFYVDAVQILLLIECNVFHTKWTILNRRFIPDSEKESRLSRLFRPTKLPPKTDTHPHTTDTRTHKTQVHTNRHVPAQRQANRGHPAPGLPKVNDNRFEQNLSISRWLGFPYLKSILAQWIREYSTTWSKYGLYGPILS